MSNRQLLLLIALAFGGIGAVFMFAEPAESVDETACIAANGEVLRMRTGVVCVKR